MESLVVCSGDRIKPLQYRQADLRNELDLYGCAADFWEDTINYGVCERRSVRCGGFSVPKAVIDAQQ